MSPFIRAACLFLFVSVFFRALGAGQEAAPQSAPQDPAAARSAPSPTPQPTPPEQPTPSPTPANPSAEQPASPSTTEQEREIQKKEQSQRILGVVPQFSVTSRQHPPPLTDGQKFHLFVRSSFDPVEFAIVGFQAGLGQAQDSFPSYGQGASGYAKRYGAAFADAVSSNFFSNFAYPVLLKEDPRYFRLGEGTIKHRIGYSLAQEFVCVTDKGTRTFNWSNVLGALTSGGISNAYYPPENRGFGLTMRGAGIALLYGSLGGLVDEFWTDIDQKLFHRKKKDPGTSTQPSPNH